MRKCEGDIIAAHFTQALGAEVVTKNVFPSPVNKFILIICADPLLVLFVLFNLSYVNREQCSENVRALYVFFRPASSCGGAGREREGLVLQHGVKPLVTTMCAKCLVLILLRGSGDRRLENLG